LPAFTSQQVVAFTSPQIAGFDAARLNALYAD
jgi:hypothetical protein